MVKPEFEPRAVGIEMVHYNPALASVIQDRQTGEPVPAMTADDYVGFTREDGIQTGNALNCFYSILRAFATQDERRYCAISPDYSPENRNSQLGLRVSAAPDILQHIQEEDFLLKQRNFSEQSFVHFLRYVDALLTPPGSAN